MKYCSFCGHSIEDNSLFCTQCGKRVVPSNEITNDAQLLKQCAEIFSSRQNIYDFRDQTQIKISEMGKPSNAVIVISCLVLGFIISNALDYTFWSMGIQGLGVAGTFILIGIVLPVFLIGRRKKQVKALTQNVQQADGELRAYYGSVTLPISLAYEYSNPRIISLLVRLIESGRADTVKEAINCMINDQLSEGLGALRKKAKSSVDSAALFAFASYWKNKK